MNNSPAANRLDSAQDRIAEIGEILALGLMRLRAWKSSKLCGESGESSLDFVGQQSGHRNTETERMGR